MYHEVTEKVLSIIKSYRDEQIALRTESYIYAKHDHKARCRLFLYITTEYLSLRDRFTNFKVWVSATDNNKSIEVTGYPTWVKKSTLNTTCYNYLDILSGVLTLDDVDREFHPSSIEENIYRQLHIHKRNKIIDNLI